MYVCMYMQWNCELLSLALWCYVSVIKGVIDMSDCCEVDNMMLDLYAYVVKLWTVELRTMMICGYIYDYENCW
jgi:hypothetical protein